MNFNKVLLGGRLTRDPEMRFTQSQTAVCEFSLATSRKFRSGDGEQREETAFVDCTAWGRTAEIIGDKFRKGKPIFIEGRLKFDTWSDRNGGGKRTKLSVTVDNFQFVGGRQDDGAQQSPDDDYSQVSGEDPGF